MREKMVSTTANTPNLATLADSSAPGLPTKPHQTHDARNANNRVSMHGSSGDPTTLFRNVPQRLESILIDGKNDPIVIDEIDEFAGYIFAPSSTDSVGDRDCDGRARFTC